MDGNRTPLEVHPVIGLSYARSAPSYSDEYRSQIIELAERVQSYLLAGGADVIMLDASVDGVPDMHRLDGVVVMGGGDVDPELYHSEGDPSISCVDAAADRFESSLIRRAVESYTPVLGICRGMQVMNVAFGGSLIEDLGAESMHRSGSSETSMVDHPVQIVEDSLLFSLMRTPEIQVRSSHHQAVQRLANTLQVSAWAEDGVVEAIEAKHQPGVETPWVLGVQWHPEDKGTVPGQLETLTAALVKEAERNQLRKSDLMSAQSH
ncbi:gamma-glutamyl-gamma-aminobutyrate hydrolase family protein [Neomicrococcus lactis]